MNSIVAFWIAAPAVLFLGLTAWVAFVGYRTRELQFRSRMGTPTPAIGRRGTLVNVAVPADRALPSGGVQYLHTDRLVGGTPPVRTVEPVRPGT
ncbi:hypothetical protein E1293_02330 [Actinomadura darangshiensis]|uniref:Uncharacterized protein n=1 Tax=Actinomadura darangshiensis TaxID=705336 RepID=A0A4R5BZ03_9ACTN|nr:hypothetical protein [Actinomadura darangshiensis]TDD91439.1 hypothetical protein E1293_02330 [Actinomadura darangshiensis]